VAEARDFSPTSCKAETVTEKEGFTWKGHKPLELRAGPIKQEAGFQPSLVLQITPPASVTSLSMARQWGVLAVGTAHGVVVLDYSFQVGRIITCLVLHLYTCSTW
jgi:lethal(2) giant larvae protein